MVGVDDDGAVVASDDVAGDGQAEPGATGDGGAGLVEADEAFDDVLALVGRDAGTVVGDAQDGRMLEFGESDGHGCAGVTGSVVGEVADRAGQLIGVALHLGAGDGADVDDDPAVGAEPGRVTEDDVIEVDRLMAGGVRAGVAAGQMEQVLV